MSSTPTLSFMIVGTPRSGTTLVQRLVSEISGVWVSPETHFFDVVLPRLANMHRRRWLVRDQIAEAIASLGFDGVDVVGVQAVFDGMDLRRFDVWDTFVRIVDARIPQNLAPLLIGEKTPAHIRWVNAVARRSDSVKFVVVVRDPRGVVASLGKVPWESNDPGPLARQWSLDSKQARNLAARWGPERVLVIRFEDLLVDEAAFRSRFAQFVGIENSVREDKVVSTELFRSDEPWRSNAVESVDPGRSVAWEHELDNDAIAVVEWVAGREMRRWGYSARDRAGVRPAWVKGLGPELPRIARRSIRDWRVVQSGRWVMNPPRN